MSQVNPRNNRITRENFKVAIYLFLATAVYACIWSYIGIKKMLALNAYVFDLGIGAERGWQIMHTNMGVHGYLLTMLNSAIVFPLSPLTSTGNFYAMIILQAVVIASVGPALYMISKEKNLGWKVSLMVTAAFFMYFPVYGIMWFDFHYQAFFFPLFVYGYLLYLRKNYVSSVFLFVLSGLVRFPYSIFPLGFAFVELLLILSKRSSDTDRRRTLSMLLLAVLMGLFTILGIYFLGFSNTFPHNTISQFTISQQSIWFRLFVVFLFLAPLLFLPVLSIRWIAFTIPAFYVILTSNYTWYLFPHIFEGQYVSGIVPFLLLGMIDSIKHVRSGWRRNHLPVFSPIKKRKLTLPTALVATVIVVLLTMNSVLAPFSPLDQQYMGGFNYQQNTNSSSAVYAELNSMIKLIPASDPYVAYQNNIPEVLPRSLPYNEVILVGGYLGSLSSITVKDAIDNSWPVILKNGTTSYVPIDYAIADARNSNFYLPNLSTYQLVNTMFSSGKYGIASEGYGLILLERNYTGGINSYVPEDVSFSTKSFFNISGLLPGNHSITMVNDTSDSVMFNGPETYLFPGKYTVSFLLKTDNLNASNGIWLQVSANSGNTSLGLEHISGTLFEKANEWQEFNLTVIVKSIYGKVNFQGLGIEWNGTLSFNGVSLKQTLAYGNLPPA